MREWLEVDARRTFAQSFLGFLIVDFDVMDFKDRFEEL